MNNPLTSYSLKELSLLVQEYGQPKYRASQLAHWLYSQQVHSYEEMKNIPKPFLKILGTNHPLYIPQILNKQTSSDGTQKYILKFYDGSTVETVLLPSKDDRRLTVCCSTQVGCAMACAFCATGRAGFKRNLTPGEICGQISFAEKEAGQRISNVVMMGQGEPFLNYTNTLNSLRILNHPKLFNIGARHITLSTCGIVPGIIKLSEEKEQFTLAVSLHSALQSTRDILMPQVKQYSLPTLKKALKRYVSRTNRRISLEYALIDGINDSEEELHALTAFAEDLLCHINLIPLNCIPTLPFQPSSQELITSWFKTLNRQGRETTVRQSRGVDISGACGQLNNSIKQHKKQR